MVERLRKLAKVYGFKLQENRNTVFLNKNMLGGRFTRLFSKRFVYDPKQQISIPDPDDAIRLEELITQWLLDNGPLLEKVCTHHHFGEEFKSEDLFP